MEQKMVKNVNNTEKIFAQRMEKHQDELRWLYMELYGNDAMYAELCEQMHDYYLKRSTELKKRDIKKEKNPDWFKEKEMLGMMLYIDHFAGNLKGVEKKLAYLKECNVNCLHLMPFLDTPKGKSDGGYAVADFRKVRPDLGTMKDLARLTEKCHENGMNVCMDFVMNHTSEEHEWAKHARAGEGEYMSRYFFYDNGDIPARYEETVPQVFPTTAPGNFTWLPEIGHYVLTTFYPYQWDLNYRNPRVFNEMMYNFLFLANQGMDIIRIDAVPYIWKELGTSCRNLKEVHTIVRMMRMIAEIVCPSVILLGEVVMEPEKVVPYFGTVEKPECHMLYNVTTMATTWNSIATRDIRLLKKQMDIVSRLPKQYTFLNYLRCHDDFTGKIADSISRGELYNDDPVTQDARFCGTTASMCGIEAAGFEGNAEKMQTAIQEDLMLHAYMLTQSGIPMLYSGDELGQVNDYSYKDDAEKASDSRYLHRGAFLWELADKRKDLSTVQGQLFQMLNRQENVFSQEAEVYTYDVHNDSILGILREYKGERFIALFNFSESEQTAWMQEEGIFRNLVNGEIVEVKDPVLKGYDFVWMKYKV